MSSLVIAALVASVLLVVANLINKRQYLAVRSSSFRSPEIAVLRCSERGVGGSRITKTMTEEIPL
jgi:hypothetical protein